MADKLLLDVAEVLENSGVAPEASGGEFVGLEMANRAYAIAEQMASQSGQGQPTSQQFLNALDTVVRGTQRESVPNRVQDAVAGLFRNWAGGGGEETGWGGSVGEEAVRVSRIGGVRHPREPTLAGRPPTEAGGEGKESEEDEPDETTRLLPGRLYDEYEQDTTRPRIPEDATVYEKGVAYIQWLMNQARQGPQRVKEGARALLRSIGINVESTEELKQELELAQRNIDSQQNTPENVAQRGRVRERMEELFQEKETEYNKRKRGMRDNWNEEKQRELDQLIQFLNPENHQLGDNFTEAERRRLQARDRASADVILRQSNQLRNIWKRVLGWSALLGGGTGGVAGVLARGGTDPSPPTDPVPPAETGDPTIKPEPSPDDEDDDEIKDHSTLDAILPVNQVVDMKPTYFKGSSDLVAMTEEEKHENTLAFGMSDYIPPYDMDNPLVVANLRQQAILWKEPLNRVPKAEIQDWAEQLEMAIRREVSKPQVNVTKADVKSVQNLVSWQDYNRPVFEPVSVITLEEDITNSGRVLGQPPVSIYTEPNITADEVRKWREWKETQLVF